MDRDFRHGKRTELEWLTGKLVRLAGWRLTARGLDVIAYDRRAPRRLGGRRLHARIFRLRLDERRGEVADALQLIDRLDRIERKLAPVPVYPQISLDFSVVAPSARRYADIESTLIRFFRLKGRRQLDYITSQGCYFRCAFCADPFVYERRWTGLAPDNTRSVPEHRRVDLKRVGVSVLNRKGAISVAFTLKPRQVEYGAKKAVHLIHEVLMDFLNEPQYVQYNVDHFNLNPELA